MNFHPKFESNPLAVTQHKQFQKHNLHSQNSTSKISIPRKMSLTKQHKATQNKKMKIYATEKKKFNYQPCLQISNRY
jgi:hypothetical protein